MYITLHSWVLHGFLDSVNSLQWMDPRITFPLQPSTYSHPLTPQSCPRLLHKARSHRAKERWAASIKPKARGICNKYQWDKEICEHIHTECFFMVLFSVLRTAPKLGHILKLLLWQSVLFYWLWSTLLCLSHVNDRDTKERAHSSSPRSITTALGSFPLDTCHLRSMGRHFSQKASLPGCCGLVFGDICEIATSFRIDSAGGKRIHNDEALALVVRPGYFYRHFAFST